MNRARVKLTAPRAATRDAAPRKVRERSSKRARAAAPSAAALAAAATQPTRTLPHRATLEQRFGRDLGAVRAVDGPAAIAALDFAGAEAAAVGPRVLVRPDATLGTVAHEVTHAVQALQNGQADAGSAKNVEAEARLAEARVIAGQPVAPIRAALAPGMVAFKMPDSVSGTHIVPKADPNAKSAFQEQAQTQQAEPGTETASDEASTAPASEPVAPERAAAERNPGKPAPDQAADGVSDRLGSDVAETPVPSFEAPAIPDLEVDENASEQAAAASEAQLDAAKDAGAMMAAFRAAPPSVKAKHHDRLAQSADGLTKEDQTRFEASQPVLEARLSGTDAPGAPAHAPVPAPDTAAPTLELAPPPAAPKAQVDPTTVPTAAQVNKGGGFFASFFTAGDAGSMGTAFSKVTTSDGDVDTSAGARPGIPTKGDTDPARVATQHTAAGAQADTKRQAAAQAVEDGRGPEEVGLRSLSAAYRMEARALPEAALADTGAPGAQAFRDGGHDAQVTALFDAHHAAPMSANLAQAEADTSAAVAKRNADRQTRQAEAEAETTRLNNEADGKQRNEVIGRRKDIQTARGKAVADQKAHADTLKTQAETDRATAATEIDSQITTTDAQVARDFTKAEGDAKAEVTKGESKAEAERSRQKKNAEDQSWWDRAKGWVKAQFDKLTKFINDVFDGVRKAIKTVIDAVKTAALKLIDLAAAAIKKAIETLGKALKAAITTLLETHFPEVARVLNAAIDTAVKAAKSAVDTVADGLKSAVSAVLDTLAKAIDAILALYQKALTAVLNLAKMVLTADWAALAKMIIEPILLAFGIKPAEFYALIGKAFEALDTIIKDPARFIGNLIKAVVGGLKLFAGRLYEHLQKGVIGWLTGALGSDLKIPKTWSLVGVLDLARQIIGLTLGFIRRIAVRVLGEKAVAVIEQVMDTIATLVKGGFDALWDQITSALGNLQTLVLGQIKTFLLERVLMAAVTWLASLFNPAGAIAKLIMMTWNLLMFLKDQFGRMVELVKKVFGTLYEIATSVLEPAQKGIEAVLGRLLPMAIDLFARLLGLGNVAGRVKRIIDGVRTKIENAIVKMIRKLAGRSKGKGKSPSKPGKRKDRTDDLMKPIAVKGGGQRHTLFIREKGKNAVPVMRSVETPVEVWLKGLRSDAGIKAINPKWDETERKKKRDAIAPMIKQALAEEAQLDSAADAANKVEDAAKPGTPVKQPAPALRAEGEDLAKILTQILTALGITGGALETVFAKQIAAVSDELKGLVRSKVIARLNPAEYASLTWEQIIKKAHGDDKIQGPWKRPANTAGILQTKDSPQRQAFFDAVTLIANEKCDNKISGPEKEKNLQHFLDKYLTQELNKEAAAHFAALLSKPNLGAVARQFTTTIQQAAERYGRSGKEGPDFQIKEAIKAGNVLDVLRDFAAGRIKTYSSFQTNEKPGAGEKRVGFLHEFLDKTKTKSFRPGPNSTHVAAAIRYAKGHGVDRPHEWIKSASVQKLLAFAADALQNQDPKKLKGAAELIEFQYFVRTPTIKLIFKPGGKYPSESVTVPYTAKAHHDSAEHRNTAQADLPDDLKAKWYPAGGPAQGDTVTLLQGHSGGIYAHAYKGAFSATPVQQHIGSSQWHTALEQTVDTAAKTLVETGSAKPLKDAIMQHYTDTVWQGIAQFSSSASLSYPTYYDSPTGGTPKTYNQVRGEFRDAFGKEIATMSKQMTQVLSR